MSEDSWRPHSVFSRRNQAATPALLQDKRKEIEEALKGLKERLGDHHPQKEKLLQGLKENIAEFHREKLPNLYQVLLNKTKELGEGLQGPKETTSQFLQEKLSWFIALWKAFVDCLVQNLEALLRPGTSSDTVRIWVQLVMPLLLFLSLPFLRYFLYGCFVLAWNTTIACAKAAYWATIEIIKACARVARGTTKGGSGKMMKAPGRAGLRIARSVFESDPGSYFRGLHANAPWQGAMPNSKSKWFIGVGVVTAGVGLLLLL